MSFQGKVVLVVGGGSGIGLAVARAARERGASVVIGGRSIDPLRVTAHELGGETRALALDVGDETSVAEALATLPHIDHVFLSAYEAATGTLDDTQRETMRPALDSKIWGALHVAKHAAPKLARDGSLTFISGLAGRRGYKGLAVAGAANAGVEALARNLAVELAPVRVNTVCAGVIDTPMLDRVFGARRAETVAAIAAKLPIGRIGRADEVADAVLFAMSNGFLNGATLLLDGGDALV